MSMDGTTDAKSADEAAVERRPRFVEKLARYRWHAAATIFSLGVIAQALLWTIWQGNRTFQVFSVLYVWPADLFVLLLWWLFWPGCRLRTRLLGVVILGGIAGLLGALLRIDDVGGDMVPQITWSWQPTAEQSAVEYWEKQELAAAAKEDPAASGTAESAASEAWWLGKEDWPGFRGPDRDGVVTDADIRTDWNARPPAVIWKHPVGAGWSSFAVVGGRAYTQEQLGDDEAVVCYDFASGNPLWKHTDRAHFDETVGGPGPRATPTFSQGRIYSLGATGILNCLDAMTGTPLWTTNILKDAQAKNLNWGMAGSPLVLGGLADGTVIVNPGGQPNKSVIAYDAQTGKVVWTAPGGPAGYTAARLVELAGMRQLLVFHGTGLQSYDPDGGKVLWQVPWENSPQVNAVVPLVIDDHHLFFGTGYSVGSASIAVERSADGTWTTKTEWTSNLLKLKFNGAVIHDGFVYGLDEGILTCLDLSTGKRVWKKGRYGYGQILLVDDWLLIQAESGEVVLLAASPDRPEETARFQALEGKTWNHPVLVQGRLLVRNAREAACYDLRPWVHSALCSSGGEFSVVVGSVLTTMPVFPETLQWFVIADGVSTQL